MYLYKITNLINGKGYIGITNDYKRRWANHKCNNDPTMAIAKAIKKYGVENFKFEVLLSNIPLEEIDDKEIEYIKKYHTHVTEHGYNISKGGRYNIENVAHIGVKNGRALLTLKEVQYIKDHRDIPEYVLYDDFSEKISYGSFKDVYLNKTYTDIKPSVDPYPDNLKFSCQFTSGGKLTYSEVVELRKQYQQGVYWREAYKKYQDLYPNERSFWSIYNGLRYQLVMPEVFTEENKKKHSHLRACGSKNSHAKVTEEDVIQMRKWFESKAKTRKEIQELYKDKISAASVNNILRYKTWTNI